MKWPQDNSSSMNKRRWAISCLRAEMPRYGQACNPNKKNINA